MGAAEGDESRYLIPFGDHVLDVHTKVRHCGMHPPNQVLVAVDAMLVFGKHVAAKNVRSDEVVDSLRVMLVPNLLVQPKDEGLVLFSRHRFSSFPRQPLMSCSWNDTGCKYQSCQGADFRSYRRDSEQQGPVRDPFLKRSIIKVSIGGFMRSRSSCLSRAGPRSAPSSRPWLLRSPPRTQRSGSGHDPPVASRRLPRRAGAPPRPGGNGSCR